MIPVLCYPNPSAAAEWLEKAFGFTVRLRIANHRIQMRAGHGCFTVREGNIVPNQSCIVQVRIDDALAHCERARRAGAKILTEPSITTTASASTTRKTSTATDGTLRRPCTMWTRKLGRHIG